MHGAIGDWTRATVAGIAGLDGGGKLAVTPAQIADAIIDDRVAFPEIDDDLSGKIRDNASEDEPLVQELLEEEGEESSLACSI